MRLPEKTGYVLEHLLLLELERRGIQANRSERVSNESIKSDISFRYESKDYILFVTHTRTQGMTNRKFYRTFEELAQRRCANPESICIDVSLVANRASVRKQQPLIFEQLFDHALSIIDSSLEKSFVAFVQSLGKKVELEITRENEPELADEITHRVSDAIDAILAVERNTDSALSKYWNLESNVASGVVSFDPNDCISIKKGMKALALLPLEHVVVSDIRAGSVILNRILPDEVLSHLTRTSLCTLATKTLSKTRLVFSDDVIAAAGYCRNQAVTLDATWYEDYLTTEGAKRLHSDLMDFPSTSDRTRALSAKLASIKTEKRLRSELKKDYQSSELRCDLFDLAIRCSGYTQNELSLEVVDSLGVNIHASDSLVYVIGKSEVVDTIVGDVDRYIEAAASLIWNRCGGHFSDIDVEEFYAARLTTYFANYYVAMERVILDSGVHGVSQISSTRRSVLPRLSGLPAKYRMSVVGARAYQLAGGQQLFITSISTPEARHHKHKEFSGKIRAIRYDYEDGALSIPKIRFVCVVDGNWTVDQLQMLANAGWEVVGWSQFASICQDVTDSQE